MIDLLIEKYRRGEITAGHAAVQLVHKIEACHPERVLQGVPLEILIRIRGFVKSYRPGGMVTNFGILPAVDQVEAAGRWIDANLEVHK
jgi:hypothetical protein